MLTMKVGGVPRGRQHRRAGTLLFVALLLVLPQETRALPSFSSQDYLNSTWATDGVDEDSQLHIATDGSTRWIAVWSSDTTLGGSIGSDRDILYVVSADGGLTWSAPASLNIDAAVDAGDDYLPRVGYNGAGEWVVVWERLSFGGGLMAARSVDDGASWGPVTQVDSIGGSDLEMVVAGSTVVVLAVSSLGGPFGDDNEVVYYRSADSGATWASLAVLNSAASVDQPDQEDIRPSLATDGSGNWLAVWELEDSGDSLLQQAVSIDDGVSWSSTVSLSAMTGGIDDMEPAIATDGAGRWIVVWSTWTDGNPPFLLPATGGDVLFSISDDLGSTWTQAAVVNSTAVVRDSGISGSAAIATDGTGNWIVGWNEVGLGSPFKSGKSDHDLFIASSVDNGDAWGAAAVLNSGATDDDKADSSDIDVRLRYDGTGTWLAAWQVNPSGVDPGQDPDFLFARAVDTCPTTPASGCIGTTTPGRSRIKLSNKPGQRGKLQWKTSRVQETVPADLGDPTASSSFVLCIYDGRSGGDRLVYERPLVAGATCGGSPCWKAVSGGYSYRDRKLDNGPIKKMQIQTGPDGEAKYQIVAKGEKLGLPAMPFELASPLRAQLISQDSGTCWDAAFGAPDENSADAFKGRSD